MALPLDIIAFYIALVAWVALLAIGFTKRNFTPFILFGVLLLVALNGRYAIEDASKSIAFFVGIYDVLHNLGVSDHSTTAALVKCAAGNECSVWGQTYQHHPSWGVAFYQRFADGNQARANTLYGHIFFISLAFVVMMYQLYRPGTGNNPRLHRQLGYLSLVSLAIGVTYACLLASEHGAVAHYGGNLSMLGFYFMACCVGAYAVMVS